MAQGSGFRVGGSGFRVVGAGPGFFLLLSITLERCGPLSSEYGTYKTFTHMAHTRQSWHIQASQEYGTYTAVTNMAHTRQSKPDSVLGSDSGLGCQVKALPTF